MSKVAVVLGGLDYGAPLASMGYELKVAHSVKQVRTINPDVVQFCGGTDVNPIMYHSPRHSQTGYPDIPRDSHEAAIFRFCVENQIPMLGICRGAQFLCVMNGGRLVQHVGRTHCMNHPVFYSGEEIMVTSTHHQMMWPQGEHVVEVISSPRGECYEVADNNDKEKEYLSNFGGDVEAVYWPETRSLGAQWHPEYMAVDAPGFQLYVTLANKLLSQE